MSCPWIDPATTLLNGSFPLPLDAPFTRATAARAGLTDRRLTTLIRGGQVRRVLRGVYASAQAPDSVRFRATALALVLPEHAVVSGRTAAWLHGMPILERGSHLVAPPLHVSDRRDTRMRRAGVSGDRRLLQAGDIAVIHGIRATTALRTACDLGRMLWRFDALAAMDAALALGVEHDRLLRATERFKGYRGVCQLRALAPLADPGAESPGESALRLHWLDAGLPRPQAQVPVQGPGWTAYRLDLGLEPIRYGVEYDGQEHHSSEEDRLYDVRRREWIRDQCGWTLDVFTKDDVYARRPTIVDRLQDGARRARTNLQRWAP